MGRENKLVQEIRDAFDIISTRLTLLHDVNRDLASNLSNATKNVMEHLIEEKNKDKQKKQEIKIQFFRCLEGLKDSFVPFPNELNYYTIEKKKLDDILKKMNESLLYW